MAKIKKEDLIHLTSEQIKLSFKAENVLSLPSPIKEYILEGKEKYDMGPRLNRIEKILSEIIVNRFLSDSL